MTLTQLEYFCTVCRYHSITQAAAALYVSQPTISTSIRDLENEFHLKLFNHGRNRISLTRDGEEFYQKAENILKQTQDLYTDFSDAERNRHPLKIGIPPILSTVFFPVLADRFQEKYGIPIQLFEYGSIRAKTLIESEELDIALVNMDFYNLEKYNSSLMMEDQYVYCVSTAHRYACEKEITMEMVKDESVILYNTDSVQTQTVISRLRRAGITPDVRMYSSQLTTILNFVRGGNCGAFLFSSLAINSDDFVMIPIVPKITGKFGIIWKKGIFMRKQLLWFVNFCQEFTVTPCCSKF